jgi:hypothetical protein
MLFARTKTTSPTPLFDSLWKNKDDNFYISLRFSLEEQRRKVLHLSSILFDQQRRQVLLLSAILFGLCTVEECVQIAEAERHIAAFFLKNFCQAKGIHSGVSSGLCWNARGWNQMSWEWKVLPTQF